MPQYNMVLETARTFLVIAIGLGFAILIFNMANFKKIVNARISAEGSIVVRNNEFPSWYTFGRRHIACNVVMLYCMAALLALLNMPIIVGVVGVPHTTVPNDLIVVFGLVIFVLSLMIANMFRNLDKKYGKLISAVVASDYLCIAIAVLTVTLNSFVSTGFFSS